jgi:Na+/proline symporter
MQGAFFLIVGWGLAVFLAVRSGGVYALFSRLAAEHPKMLGIPGGAGTFPWGLWFSLLFLYTWFPALRPDTWVRALATRDLKHWKRACIMTTIILPITYLLSMFQSFSLKFFVPGLTGVQAERALMEYFGKFAPLFGTIVLAAATAAAMSTVDSLLLVVSQFLTEDLLKKYFAPGLREETATTAGRYFIVGLSLLCFLVAMQPPKFMVLMTALFYGFSSVFWPVLGCLYWPRGTKAGAVSSLVVSNVIYWVLYLKMFGLPQSPFGIHYITWGVILGGAAYVVVSLATAPPSQSRIEEYHGLLRRVFFKV